MSYGEVVSTDSTRAASGEVGRGVLSTAVQRVNSQGAVVNSASPLDMAIEGDGFFAVRVKQTAKVKYSTPAMVLLLLVQIII